MNWSFVSNGDEFASYAFHSDEKVGLSKADAETVMEAMRQIEASSCIKEPTNKFYKQNYLYCIVDNWREKT